MLGWLQWTGPEEGKRLRRMRVEPRTVLHTRFLAAEIPRGPRTPETVTRRRVLAAARRMRKAGVTRVVVPEEFSYGAQLEKGGLMPEATTSLRRAMAADLTRSVLAGRGLAGVRLAVAGDRLSSEMVRTVTALALRSRYVMLDVPQGAVLADRLRREYGVSLLLFPPRERLAEAEILVLFEPRTDLPRDNPAVLELYDEAAPLPPLLLPPVLEEQLPQGLCRSQLISALVESGVLPLGQITVGKTV